MDILSYYLKMLDTKQMLIGRTDSKGSAVLIIISFITSASMVVLFRLNAAWQQYFFASIYGATLLAILFLDVFKVLMPRVKTNVCFDLKSPSDEALIENTRNEIEKLDTILKRKNRYLAIVFCLLILMAVTLIASTICTFLK